MSISVANKSEIHWMVNVSDSVIRVSEAEYPDCDFLLFIDFI
jgi:hypothetical protein